MPIPPTGPTGNKDTGEELKVRCRRVAAYYAGERQEIDDWQVVSGQTVLSRWDNEEDAEAAISRVLAERWPWEDKS